SLKCDSVRLKVRLGQLQCDSAPLVLSCSMKPTDSGCKIDSLAIASKIFVPLVKKFRGAIQQILGSNKDYNLDEAFAKAAMLDEDIKTSIPQDCPFRPMDLDLCKKSKDQLVRQCLPYVKNGGIPVTSSPLLALNDLRKMIDYGDDDVDLL